MKINFFKEKSPLLNLPILFDYLGFEKIETTRKHVVYSKRQVNYVTFLTDQGAFYYRTEAPEKKLNALDLIKDYVGVIEGEHNASVWKKTSDFITQYTERSDIFLDSSKNSIPLDKVGLDYNHFLFYNNPFTQTQNTFYNEFIEVPIFKNRLFLNDDNAVIFPLFNGEDSVCGYLKESDSKHMIGAHYTNKGFGIWFSNLPKTPKYFFVFNTPKEALAFHAVFKPDHVVYVAINEVNNQTTEVLAALRKRIRAKKIYTSFTGLNSIEGYLRDLQFISSLEPDNFNVSVNAKSISIVFNEKDSSQFAKFFNKTKQFNNELSKDYLKYNDSMNQSEVNKYIIGIAKNKDRVQLKIPFDVNAIKFLVWNYNKHYLSRYIEIIKPTEANWYTKYKTNVKLNTTAYVESFSEYRIAL